MYISCLVTISKPECVESAISQLDRVINDLNTYELVVGVDNRELSIIEIEKKIAALQCFKLFKNIEIVNTKNHRPAKFNMSVRRNRIVQLHKLMQEVVGGSEFVFCYEDDTVLIPNTIDRLLDDWKRMDVLTGLIEGVQVGRWGRKYLGAWVREDDKLVSLLPKGYEEFSIIDGGGFYCFLTPTSLYRETEMQWKEPMGPDYWYGKTLTEQGYTNFVDWDVQCGHITPNGMVLYPDESCVSLEISVVNNRTIVKERGK